MVSRCRPKILKSRRKVSSLPHSEKIDSSSNDDEDQDNMLYIPMDSDEEIDVRSVDSERSNSSASESSDNKSSDSESSSRYTHDTTDGKMWAW